MRIQHRKTHSTPLIGLNEYLQIMNISSEAIIHFWYELPKAQNNTIKKNKAHILSYLGNATGIFPSSKEADTCIRYQR